MSLAPLALAFERALECAILSRQEFIRPVLDLGCGDGLFGRILFADAIDAGVDVDPVELQRASRWGIYRELLQTSSEKLPKPDSTFNTILSNSVLEHIANLPSVLSEMHRVLKPGGKVFATVPTERFEQYSIINQFLVALSLHRVAARYRRVFNAFWKHQNIYSREGWEQLFKASGFGVLEAREYDPKGLCLLNDLLVPFGAFAFLSRRLHQRWTWFPGLRRVLLYPVYLAVKRVIRRGERADGGGLIFFALAKGN